MSTPAHVAHVWAPRTTRSFDILDETTSLARRGRYGVLIRLVHQAGHVRADTVVVEQTLDATGRREGEVLVPDVLLRDVLQLRRGDSVNGRLDLLRREALALSLIHI